MFYIFQNSKISMNDFCDLLGTLDAPVSKIASVKEFYKKYCMHILSLQRYNILTYFKLLLYNFCKIDLSKA